MYEIERGGKTQVETNFEGQSTKCRLRCTRHFHPLQTTLHRGFAYLYYICLRMIEHSLHVSRTLNECDQTTCT